LGPQVRVDREDAALRGGPRTHPDHPGGEAAGGGQRGGLVLVLERFGHEDHVDVAGVVELAAAALAHGHDGQAGGGGAGGEFGPRHGERRFEDPAAMSASSSPTSSTVTALVRSRAVRCSSRRRYAAASAAVGSWPAATGPSRPPGPGSPGSAPTARSSPA